MKIDLYYRRICLMMLICLAGYSAAAQENFHLVKELTPGADDTYVIQMKALDGFVYFTDLDHGLMRTDGTPEGTVIIENEEHFWYMDYTPTQNGFYFRIQNWFDNVYTVGKTNGQVGAATVASISFKYVSDLTEVNGQLFFIGDDGVHGKEIWKYDGVNASMVKDIGTSSSQFDPRDLKVCNGILFFVADDGTHGAELWRTDGNTGATTMIKDIKVGTGNGWPVNLEVLNNELYFNANDGPSGQELWKTNGTAEGTVMIKDIESGNDSSGPRMLTRVGDAIYFEAYDNQNGRALWRTEGTAETTTFVKDIHPATDYRSYISSLTEVNGVLYFAADYEAQGMALWKLEGPIASILQQVTAGAANEIELKNFSSVNNHLFFVSKGQLWKTDGNLCNTVQLTSADGISYMDWLLYVVMVNDKLFFQATTADTGGELFYYDYSAGGPKGICNQSIEFADIGSKTYGDDPFILDAVASSELPVTFTSSDPAILSISGNTATIKSDGEVTITATQAGDVDYAPASTGRTIVIDRRIITAVEPERASKVSVYPNPVVDYLMLQGFSSNEHINVRLYRADGKLVGVEELSGKADYQLEMASLTPGIYVVTITSGNRYISERIIKK